MDTRKEDKTDALPSSLPIAKETGMTIDRNRMCKFADGTFGIYGNIRKKSFWSSGFEEFPFLSVYSTNPLKLVDTFVSPTGNISAEARNPLKLQGDVVFLSAKEEKNRLEIHNIYNQKIFHLHIKAEDDGEFDVDKATPLNQTCFAVPYSCSPGYSSAHSIFVFELNHGKLSLINEICLSQPHPGRQKYYPQQWFSPAFKTQIAKLPFDLARLLHMERLTDDSFIVHGKGVNTPYDPTKPKLLDESFKEVVLKCNIKDGNIRKLLTLENNDNSAVRVLNSKRLVRVGDNEKNHIVKFGNSSKMKRKRNLKNLLSTKQ